MSPFISSLFHHPTRCPLFASRSTPLPSVWSPSPPTLTHRGPLDVRHVRSYGSLSFISIGLCTMHAIMIAFGTWCRAFGPKKTTLRRCSSRKQQGTTQVFHLRYRPGARYPLSRQIDRTRRPSTQRISFDLSMFREPSGNSFELLPGVVW